MTDCIQEIYELPEVEVCEPSQGFYFNRGTIARVTSLINELKAAGVDPTVCCFAPPHDPQNCYYTPKNATMIKSSWK